MSPAHGAIFEISPGYVAMSERCYLIMTKLANCITWVWRNWWTVSHEYDAIGELYHLSMTKLVNCTTWVWRNWWTVPPEYDAIGELYHLSMTQLVNCITSSWASIFIFTLTPSPYMEHSQFWKYCKWKECCSTNYHFKNIFFSFLPFLSDKREKRQTAFLKLISAPFLEEDTL